MAFITLEDTTGSINVVVFPRTYQEYGDLLEEDAVLLIKARVDYREEELQLIAEKITAPSEMELNHNGSDIHHEVFVPRKTSKETLQKLGKLLKGNPGEESVIILIPNGSKPQRMRLPYGVNWSDKLENEIAQLLT